MNRAVFLDRDGTINEDAEYLNDPKQLKILPFVIAGLKKLQKAGFLLIITTNQSGIGRGYYPEKKLIEIHQHLIKMLSKQSIFINKIFYSAHHESSKIARYRKGANFRKPQPGMLLQAQKEFNIDLSASYMIGDKESDIGAGINAGLKCNIYLKNDHYPYSNKYEPDYTVKNFKQATEIIIKQEIQSHIIVKEQDLSTLVNKIKHKKKKIVTTNGVFDILHIGHLRYLSECKKSGDILIVGINSDSSVKIIKGDLRPINSQFSRAEIIAQLKVVDFVYIFNEKDPKAFLKIVKPDVHVKGADYSLGQIPERQVVEAYGGKIKLIKFVKGYSTTNTINKIKEVYL